MRFEWHACARAGFSPRRAHAEERHRPWSLLQHVREVLGAHHRHGHAPASPAFRAASPATRSANAAAVVVVRSSPDSRAPGAARRACRGRRRYRAPAARSPRWRAAATLPRRARNVPTISTVSGMTLFVVPARIFVIVITTGSKVLMRRVTSTCSACTISAATGIGSLARYGVDACPPLAGHRDLEHVGRRHERAALRPHRTRRQVRRHVQRERGVDVGRARLRRSCSARRGSLLHRVGT